MPLQARKKNPVHKRPYENTADRRTVKKALADAEARLALAGVPDPRADGEWLLCHILSCPRSMLRLGGELSLAPPQAALLEKLLARREKREPLQHILGTQPFCGLELRCDRRGLIPRPETELLCELAIRLARQEGYGTALDIGTGTGAIALALKKHCPFLEVTAADISAEALSLAAENARAAGLSIELLQSDLWKKLPQRRFDLIVSNPPYIPTGELAALEPEVRSFDPVSALDGGADGLDFYRWILAEAATHLHPGGAILFEIGAGQAEEIRRLFAQNGFLTVQTAVDYAGIERVLWAKMEP